jgi:hypothetical protein
MSYSFGLDRLGDFFYGVPGAIALCVLVEWGSTRSLRGRCPKCNSHVTPRDGHRYCYLCSEIVSK